MASKPRMAPRRAWTGVAWACLLTACAAASAGESPVTFGSLAGRLYALDRLHLPPPGETGFRSGNADAGGYLRLEGGAYVLAEMEGPGAVTRIWAENPAGVVSIYVDDGAAPIVKQSFRSLFTQNAEPFVRPLTGRHGNAYVSRAPIPYARFCKITCTEPVRYEIEYQTFPPQTEVVPLKLPLGRESSRALNRAARAMRISIPPRELTRDPVRKIEQKLRLAAGSSIQFATLTGPAVLRGLEIRWPSRPEALGRDVLLSIEWDGERHPAVLAPLHDFFGGFGKTMAIGRDGSGLGYCYFPMPFASEARLRLIHDKLDSAVELDAAMYVEDVTGLPEPLRTFRARWTDGGWMPGRAAVTPGTPTLVAKPEENWTAADFEGPGHAVALTLHRPVGMTGDSRIAVRNRDAVAGFAGPGGYGLFDWTAGGAAFDSPMASGNLEIPPFASACRLFHPFSIGFMDRLRILFERGPANTMPGPLYAVAYWYGEAPPEPPEWPPAAAGRAFPDELPPRPVYLALEGEARPESPAEGENLSASATAGLFEPRDTTPWGPGWSRNRHLRYESREPGSALTLELGLVEYSGWYAPRLRLTRSPAGGTFQIKLRDEVSIPEIDLRSEKYEVTAAGPGAPVFLHAGEEAEIRFVLAKVPEGFPSAELGVDTAELAAPLAGPDALTVLGPFSTAPAGPNPSMYRIGEATRRETNQSPPGHPLPAGYLPAYATRPAETVIQPGENGLFATPGGEPGATHWFTWHIEAGKTGIYRLEFETPNGGPFLLQPNGGEIAMATRRIAVNGMAVKANPGFRLDPAKPSLTARVYPAPLKEGANRVSWLMPAGGAPFRVRVYGLAPDGPLQ